MKLLVSLLLISFCLPALSAGSVKGDHGMDESTKRLPLDLKAKAELVRVLEANEKLHAGFFTYKAGVVEEAAKNLRKVVRAVSNTKTRMLLKDALKPLDQIKAKNKREANNVAYHKASLVLAGMVNSYDVGSSYNVYSCPMVKKTWIQNSKKQLRTHNPYAPEMPHCGGRDTDY